MRADKVRILNTVLGRGFENGSETLYSCPKCGHRKKKLSVNIDKNVFKCWVCDYSGKDITNLISFYGKTYLQEWTSLHRPDLSASVDIVDLFQPKQSSMVPALELPESFQLISNPDFKYRNPITYLKSRGISSLDILKWRIGFCPTGPYANRVIIPSFSSKGKLNYFVARSVDKKTWPKYKNPSVSNDVIFNEIMINWNQPVTLVEGVFDAMKTKNSIPLLGSTLRLDSVLVEKLSKTKAEIIIALDSDAYDKSLKIYKLLSQYGLRTSLVNIRGKRDLGDMGKQEVKELFNTATDINQDNYLLYEINKIS